MSAMAGRAWLLERLRSSASRALSGRMSSVRSYRMSDRPFYWVECRETGHRLAVKASRLNRRLLKAQMAYISFMKRYENFVPLNFGFCEDDAGTLFEIWEWLDDDSSNTISPELASACLEEYFCRFVRSAGKVPVRPDIVFPNDTSRVIQGIADRETRAVAERSFEDDQNTREVLDRASDALKCVGFRRALAGLPRALVHTDIRLENVRGRFLIDYSNAKIDARIIEVARFINLNFELPALTSKYASHPWLAFGDSELLLSEEEREYFMQIVFVDFTSVYTWARQQLLRNAYRREWAAEFVTKASANLLQCFSAPRTTT